MACRQTDDCVFNVVLNLLIIQNFQPIIISFIISFLYFKSLSFFSNSSTSTGILFFLIIIWIYKGLKETEAKPGEFCAIMGAAGWLLFMYYLFPYYVFQIFLLCIADFIFCTVNFHIMYCRFPKICYYLLPISLLSIAYVPIIYCQLPY